MGNGVGPGVGDAVGEGVEGAITNTSGSSSMHSHRSGPSPVTSTLLVYLAAEQISISLDSETINIPEGTNFKSAGTTPLPTSKSFDSPLSVRFSCLIVRSTNPLLVTRYL